MIYFQLYLTCYSRLRTVITHEGPTWSQARFITHPWKGHKYLTRLKTMLPHAIKSCFVIHKFLSTKHKNGMVESRFSYCPIYRTLDWYGLTHFITDTQPLCLTLENCLSKSFLSLNLPSVFFRLQAQCSICYSYVSSEISWFHGSSIIFLAQFDPFFHLH